MIYFSAESNDISGLLNSPLQYFSCLFLGAYIIPSYFTQLFENNYQQDDTFGLSFISGLVVLHSTCFELQGAHHQEFHGNGCNTAKDYTVCQRLSVQ